MVKGCWFALWVVSHQFFAMLQKQAPFKEIYLHGLVRDEKGQKMSKTKGQGWARGYFFDGMCWRSGELIYCSFPYESLDPAIEGFGCV